MPRDAVTPGAGYRAVTEVAKRGAQAPAIVAGLATIAFAAICIPFAWQAGLASFADDSVSYLVMGQVLSPWIEPSPAVAEAFLREAFYPPLFPLLLGFTGAAADMAWAHALTAALLAASLPLVYWLGVRWVGDRAGAAVATVATALLPSLWVHVKGILSEPLFGLLVLALLCVLESGHPRRRLWQAGALMAALVLTRTVGVLVVCGYAAWALTRPGEGIVGRARLLTPALVAAVAYASWIVLRPAGVADDYMRIVIERTQDMLAADSPWLAVLASVTRQVRALVDAWVGAFLLFWPEGERVRWIIACGIGVLAMAGMLLRILQGKADAWMAAAYFVTFLLWPFYDQMTRFLFPMLPVLMLYAFAAGAAGFRALGRSPGGAYALVGVLVLSLAAPALAFIQQRAQASVPYAQMTDWYRTPGLDEARRRAQIHLDLMADMEAIRSKTGPGDRVMWVTPSYVALLADRRGVPAPPDALSPQSYRLAVQESGADFVFLSVFHPRDTLRDVAWRAGIEALGNRAQVVHARPGSAGSVLLRVPDAPLAARPEGRRAE